MVPCPSQCYICICTLCIPFLYYIFTCLFLAGWNFASYAIVDGEGSVVALDSMEDGVSRTQQHCLPVGFYELRVEEGEVPTESEWHFCGARGKRTVI